MLTADGQQWWLSPSIKEVRGKHGQVNYQLKSSVISAVTGRDTTRVWTAPPQVLSHSASSDLWECKFPRGSSVSTKTGRPGVNLGKKWEWRIFQEDNPDGKSKHQDIVARPKGSRCPRPADLLLVWSLHQLPVWSVRNCSLFGEWRGYQLWITYFSFVSWEPCEGWLLWITKSLTFFLVPSL